MTDLERDLADALHHRADQVTEDDLRHARSPRRARPWAPVIAAAAVVAAVAVGVAVAVSNHGSSPTTAGGSSVSAQDLSAAVGPRWDLVDVRSSSGARAAVRGVYVVFHHGGRVEANDSVNFYAGGYSINGSRLVLRDVAGTAAGYGGNDPSVLEVLAATGALLEGKPATGRVEGATLTITVAGFTLTFHRGADAGTGAAPSAPASGTTSGTPSASDLPSSLPS